MTKARRLLTVLTPLLALFAATACTDGGDPVAADMALPGTLSVQWAASEAVGAVQLIIEGPDIGALETPHEGAVLFVRSRDERRNVAIIGTLTSGVLVTFSVPDVRRRGLYVVRLIEVAGLDDEIRPVAEGFSATLE